MLLKKADLTYYPEIVLIGDPILDRYDDHLLPGGALNVYSNIKYLDHTAKAFFPKEDFLIYSHPNKKSVYNYYEKINNNFYAKTLVCSDYNKGFITDTTSTIYSDLLIADSKYSSLSKNIISNASVKVLKQTSTDQINFSFINCFDYLIITNHSHDIVCYKHGEKIFSFTPPSLTSQNDCGAGDVFVAVLSVHLHNSFDKQNLTVFTHAVKEAAFWAAYSTTTPFTSNIRNINVHN
jgi:hypothetical protein